MASKIFPRNIGTNCENAMRCFFDLSPLELKVYRDLLENGPGTALEIGDRISRDRSTAYRSLTNLVYNDLARKKLLNREGGGIFHVYEPVAPSVVQMMLEEAIDEWYDQMKSVVSRVSRELSG
jgi:predicted transcriptional regulator